MTAMTSKTRHSTVAIVVVIVAALAASNPANAFTATSTQQRLVKSFHRAEHLKYATLEQSNLFTLPFEHPMLPVLPEIEAALSALPETTTTKQSTGASSQPSTSTATAGTIPTEQRESARRQVHVNRHAAGDWWYNLKSLPQSSVLKEIRHPIICMTAWSTFVSIAHRLLLNTSNLSAVANAMVIPHTFHSFAASILSLLLVFRTNSAYQRFQEGRQIWEDILNVSRNFSRLITLYRDEVGSQERIQTLKNLTASFPYLLRHHVRSGCLCKKDYEAIPQQYKLQLIEPLNGRRIVDTRYEGDKAVMDPVGGKIPDKCIVDRRAWPWTLLDTDGTGASLHQIAKSPNRPLWVCDRLGKELMKIPASSHFTSRERLNMLSSVDKLSATIGQCERIHQTAVPLNYARHALRALSMWLFTLPFALVKDMGLLAGPTTGMIAWLLFGVYQIGHSIEDPFQKSLRLSTLCDAIRRDVLQEDLDGSFASQRESAFYDAPEDKPTAPAPSTVPVPLGAPVAPDTILPKFDFEDIFPKRVLDTSTSPKSGNYSVLSL